MSTVAKIRMFDSSNFTERIVLDNNVFVLGFKWNTRSLYWSMDIYDSNNVLLLAGTKLTICYPVKAQHVSASLPSGDFVLIDPNENTQTQEPGRHDFTTGRKLELCYVSDYVAP